MKKALLNLKPFCTLGENSSVHQSRSQNDSGDLWGVAGRDGELGCLCGKAGTSHLCDGSTHSSGCVVYGYGCLSISVYYTLCKLARNILFCSFFLPLSIVPGTMRLSCSQME